jgi:hypothetical protein
MQPPPPPGFIPYRPAALEVAMTIRTSSIALVVAAIAFVPALAQADDVTYPPGTECANLPTLSARLVCGRQELRRGDPAAKAQQNVPPPPYDGYIEDQDQDDDSATPPAGLVPAPPVTPTPLGGNSNAVHSN